MRRGPDYKPPFYLICNIGTFLSPVVFDYQHHLVLAQLYLARAEYRMRVAELLDAGKMLIMDNGAHEGSMPSEDEYFKAVMEARCQLVVAPDLIGRSARESWEASMKFASRTDTADHAYDHKWIYCPQGANKEDIISHFGQAYSTLNDENTIIGIGQQYLTWETPECKDEEARCALMRYILQHPKAQQFDHHILGGRWTMTSDIADWNRIISGQDSVKPVSCAINGVSYPTRPTTKLDLFSMSVADPYVLAVQCARFAGIYRLTIHGVQ